MTGTGKFSMPGWSSQDTRTTRFSISTGKGTGKTTDT